MVKPRLPYLDIPKDENFKIPVLAYQYLVNIV